MGADLRARDEAAGARLGGRLFGGGAEARGELVGRQGFDGEPAERFFAAGHAHGQRVAFGGEERLGLAGEGEAGGEGEAQQEDHDDGQGRSEGHDAEAAGRFVAAAGDAGDADAQRDDERDGDRAGGDAAGVPSEADDGGGARIARGPPREGQQQGDRREQEGLEAPGAHGAEEAEHHGDADAGGDGADGEGSAAVEEEIQQGGAPRKGGAALRLEEADGRLGVGGGDAEHRREGDQQAQPHARGQAQAAALAQRHDREEEAFHEEGQADDHREDAQRDLGEIQDGRAQHKELEEGEVAGDEGHGSDLARHAFPRVGGGQGKFPPQRNVQRQWRRLDEIGQRALLGGGGGFGPPPPGMVLAEPAGGFKRGARDHSRAGMRKGRSAWDWLCTAVPSRTTTLRTCGPGSSADRSRGYSIS